MTRLLFATLLLAVLAGCQGGPSPLASTLAAEPRLPSDASTTTDFAAWLEGFRREARAAGIAEVTLDRALAGVRYRPEVIARDRSQPEFVRPIWAYLDSAVSARRVAAGRERLADHRDIARTMEARYGVPAEVMVAIWGIESSYGSFFGDIPTLDALATLAFEGRRRDFARRELLAALRILEAGDIPPARMVGSWAGAMGHTQFLPSSFVAYAVDGDGDGRRDIWGSIPDVLASTAHYLQQAGWTPGQPWGVEVRLPDDFDFARAELATRHASQAWAARDVRTVDGEPLPEFAAASVIAPAGAQGPAFLVGPNFRAILRYNNATSYALAVGVLADRIAGREGIAADWPRGEAPLARSQVRELQRELNARGFEVGEPDGILGPNTRRGVRAYQAAIGETPDGFATRRLLERLRDGVSE